MKAIIGYIVALCLFFGVLSYFSHKDSLKTPEQRRQDQERLKQQYVQNIIDDMQRASPRSLVAFKDGSVEILASDTNGVAILITPSGSMHTNNIADVATKVKRIADSEDAQAYSYRARQFMDQLVSNSLARANSPTK